MKFEKCIVKMSEFKNDKIGTVSLPKGVFSQIKSNEKFIAVKKRAQNIIRLVPIPNPKAIIYELYCDITYGQLSQFIRGLREVNEKIKEVTLLDDILDGTCDGGAEMPCSFNGFLVVDSDKKEKINEFVKLLEVLSYKEQKIVTKIETIKLA